MIVKKNKKEFNLAYNYRTVSVYVYGLCKDCLHGTYNGLFVGLCDHPERSRTVRVDRNCLCDKSLNDKL